MACCAQAENEGHKGASAEEGPWLFTLDFPSYQPILTHAKNRCTLIIPETPFQKSTLRVLCTND